MSAKRLFGYLLCASAAILLFAAPATWAGEDAKTGHAFVRAVDVGAGRVTLAGVDYRVGPKTELLGRKGESISLSDLSAAEKTSDPRMVRVTEADYVRYRGVRRGRGWELEELQQVSRGPE